MGASTAKASILWSSVRGCEVAGAVQIHFHTQYSNGCHQRLLAKKDAVSSGGGTQENDRNVIVLAVAEKLR